MQGHVVPAICSTMNAFDFSRSIPLNFTKRPRMPRPVAGEFHFFSVYQELRQLWASDHVRSPLRSISIQSCGVRRRYSVLRRLPRRCWTAVVTVSLNSSAPSGSRCRANTSTLQGSLFPPVPVRHGLLQDYLFAGPPGSYHGRTPAGQLADDSLQGTPSQC